jgi:hypothetical protein
MDVGQLALDAVVGFLFPAESARTKGPRWASAALRARGNESEMRVFDEQGGAVVDRWPRGGVDARIEALDRAGARPALRGRRPLDGKLRDSGIT